MEISLVVGSVLLLTRDYNAVFYYGLFSLLLFFVADLVYHLLAYIPHIINNCNNKINNIICVLSELPLT